MHTKTIPCGVFKNTQNIHGVLHTHTQQIIEVTLCALSAQLYTRTQKRDKKKNMRFQLKFAEMEIIQENLGNIYICLCSTANK